MAPLFKALLTSGFLAAQFHRLRVSKSESVLGPFPLWLYYIHPIHYKMNLYKKGIKLFGTGTFLVYRALILDLYITHFSVGFSWFRALLTLVSDSGMVHWSASHKDGYGNDLYLKITVIIFTNLRPTT